MLVESSDAGIVFESFSNAQPGDEFIDDGATREWFSGHNRTTRLKTRLLFEKNPDGLRIFGGLPDATKVESSGTEAFKRN